MKRTVAYRYDGSLEGFLCCVFDSFSRREEPAAIYPESEPQITLYPEREIVTETAHAKRVWASFSKKISKDAAQMILDGFLTCAPDRELLLLRFIRLGYQYGSAVMNRLADEPVHSLHHAVRHLYNEAHLLKGFLRFSEHEGALAAVISPKNRVLPLLTPHFCSRYPEETFLIYDKTHREASIYRPYQSILIPMEGFSLPQPGQEEQEYQALWKRFYRTIGIEGRTNPTCRRTHMPMRYWENLTEQSELRPDAHPALDKASSAGANRLEH